MGICLGSSKNDEKFNEDGGEDPRFMQANIPDQEKETAVAIDIEEEEILQDGGTGGITYNNNNLQKISLQDFEFVKVLGRGSFGKVMLVTYKQNQLLYAMKILRKDMVEKRNQRIHTKNERAILESVRHPFIVRLHSAFQTQHKLYLIMDFMIGGELFFHLRRAFRFNEDRAKFYAAEIILALEYLHKKGVVYRDLKPENILLGQDGHIKITDFGLSKTNLEEGQKTNTFCGTPEYLAPEILLGQGHDQKVDWWSLGALLYEMLAGAPPFYSKDKTLMFRNRLEKPIEMKQWFSPDSQAILKKLLNNDPTLRLGFHGADEIKNDPFFNGLDWVALYKKQIEPPFKPRVFNNKDLRHFDNMFTDEPVTDTPVNVPNQQKQETYDKFTYEKNLDNSGGDFSYTNQKSMMEKFVEVNPNFDIQGKK